MVISTTIFGMFLYGFIKSNFHYLMGFAFWVIASLNIQDMEMIECLNLIK